MFKCSHGGPFDVSTDYDAKGGINKDSGYYWLSPHAHLHLKAAELAISHTEYFFNSFRQELGNEEFARFICSSKVSWLKILGISIGVLIAILVVSSIISIIFMVILLKIICSKCKKQTKNSAGGTSIKQYKFIPTSEQTNDKHQKC